VATAARCATAAPTSPAPRPLPRLGGFEPAGDFGKPARPVRRRRCRSSPAAERDYEPRKRGFDDDVQ
jgi:hypothetical protein